MAVGNASAPFLALDSFIEEEHNTLTDELLRPAAPTQSPFISVYESPAGESEFDEPLREAYTSVVNELYDEEFDESLFELLTEGRNLHQDHLASGHSLSEANPDCHSALLAAHPRIRSNGRYHGAPVCVARRHHRPRGGVVCRPLLSDHNAPPVL